MANKTAGGLLKERRMAWLKYKKVRLLDGRTSRGARDAFRQFASVNKRVRNFDVLSQASYELSMIERFRESPKLLHSHVRSKKVATMAVGPLRQPNGQISSDPEVMGEIRASSFASVYVGEVPVAQEPHQRYDGVIEPLQIAVEEVPSDLRALDSNSAMGPDFLHPLIPKDYSDTLSYPIHLIFTRSL